MRACVRGNDAISNRRQPFLVLHPSFAKQLADNGPGLVENTNVCLERKAIAVCVPKAVFCTRPCISHLECRERTKDVAFLCTRSPALVDQREFKVVQCSPEANVGAGGRTCGGSRRC